jgi:phosphatidylglycerophosphate synthase
MRDLLTPPNLVTLARIALVAAAGAAFIAGAPVAAMVLGLAGGLTDYLDGYLARRLGMATRLGAMLDQFADVFFAFVCLILALGPPVELSPIYLLVVMPRELWVQGCVRREAAALGFEIPSSRLGKWNAFFLCWGFLPLFAGGLWPPGRALGEVMIAIGCGLNAISGVLYTIAFARISGRGTRPRAAG